MYITRIRIYLHHTVEHLLNMNTDTHIHTHTYPCRIPPSPGLWKARPTNAASPAHKHDMFVRIYSEEGNRGLFCSLQAGHVREPLQSKVGAARVNVKDLCNLQLKGSGTHPVVCFLLG